MSNHDRLLHVVTARETMPIAAFGDVAEQVAALFAPTQNRDTLRAYKLARTLDMLGHAEYAQRSRPAIVAIAPPCLARLPMVDRYRYILCGARSGATKEEIHACARASGVAVQLGISSRKTIADPLVPDPMILEFNDDKEAERLCNLLQVRTSAGPAAWALACFSVGLQELESSLSWRPRTVSDHELKFYRPDKLLFEAGRTEAHGVAQRIDQPSWACILRDDEEAVVEDLDWARFWAHAAAGTSCLRYDRGRKLFSSPIRLPIPRLLARSLALCSGLPPVAVDIEGKECQIFRDVPQEIAIKIADKLGSSAVPHSINELEVKHD